MNGLLDPYQAAHDCIEFMYQAARASGDDAVVKYIDNTRKSLALAFTKEIIGRATLPPTTLEKTGGDYRFIGEMRATFTKRSGVVRVVVENADGVLHIFNPDQLSVLK